MRVSVVRTAESLLMLEVFVDETAVMSVPINSEGRFVWRAADPHAEISNVMLTEIYVDVAKISGQIEVERTEDGIVARLVQAGGGAA